MFEFLVEAIGELLLQILVEALAELGLHSTAAPFRRDLNPWLVALGYVILGSIIAGVSLWIFPANFIPSQTMRVLNVVVTPFVVGAGMRAMGAWRVRRGDETVGIDRFVFGYLFALSFALIRFGFAT